VSGDALTRRCIEDGVLLRVITNNTIQISPPFTIEHGDLERIVASITGALNRLAG
jgi:adenosylmethionine-8-amino-7-oxononanoate aminotransferase